jgi:hypothetical protein
MLTETNFVPFSRRTFAAALGVQIPEGIELGWEEILAIHVGPIHADVLRGLVCSLTPIENIFDSSPKRPTMYDLGIMHQCYFAQNKEAWNIVVAALQEKFRQYTFVQVQFFLRAAYRWSDSSPNPVQEVIFKIGLEKARTFDEKKFCFRWACTRLQKIQVVQKIGGIDALPILEAIEYLTIAPECVSSFVPRIDDVKDFRDLLRVYCAVYSLGSEVELSIRTEVTRRIVRAKPTEQYRMMMEALGYRGMHKTRLFSILLSMIRTLMSRPDPHGTFDDLRSVLCQLRNGLDREREETQPDFARIEDIEKTIQLVHIAWIQCVKCDVEALCCMRFINKDRYPDAYALALESVRKFLITQK